MNEGRVTTIQGEGVRIRVNDAGQLELESEEAILVFDYDTAFALGGEIMMAFARHLRAEKLADMERQRIERAEHELIAAQEEAERRNRYSANPVRWVGQETPGLNSQDWQDLTPAQYSAREAAVHLCHLLFVASTETRPWGARDRVYGRLISGEEVASFGRLYRVARAVSGETA